VDLWNTDLPAYNRNGTYGDYTFTQHSVQQIMNHDPSQPMFLYHAAQVAHDPMQAPQRFLDMYDPNVVPDQTEYAFSSVLDEAFDNITQALKAKGMWEKSVPAWGQATPCFSCAASSRVQRLNQTNGCNCGCCALLHDLAALSSCSRVIMAVSAVKSQLRKEVTILIDILTTMGI
jgi:hypothetical protein